MRIGRANRHPAHAGAPALRACLCASAFVLVSAVAAAQEQAPPAAQPQERGLFGSVARWFDEQATHLHSTFKDAGRRVENFGRDASLAARDTAQGAKDAADVVVRIPNTRVVAGHAQCLIAPNGAPDCVAAANAVCKAKGFTSGKSVDMTTAEICPPKVYMAGRTSGRECTTETFVSRALCQ